MQDPDETIDQSGSLFVDYLLEKYNCNLGRFCHMNDIFPGNLWSVLRGLRAVNTIPRIIQNISAITRTEVQTLFPPEVYLYRRFNSIRDAPGYAILQKELVLSQSTSTRC